MEWAEDSRKFCGQIGTVVDVDDKDSSVQVKFLDGDNAWLHANTLLSPRETVTQADKGNGEATVGTIPEAEAQVLRDRVVGLEENLRVQLQKLQEQSEKCKQLESQLQNNAMSTPKLEKDDKGMHEIEAIRQEKSELESKIVQLNKDKANLMAQLKTAQQHISKLMDVNKPSKLGDSSPLKFEDMEVRELITELII